jgi:hypothetical protein
MQRLPNSPQGFELLSIQNPSCSGTLCTGRFLRTVFPGRLISPSWDITWPTCSPSLAVADYFLWGCVKSKVYKTHPANIVDLKHWILEYIQRNTKEMLQRVMTAFPSQLRVYWMTWRSHTKCHIQTIMTAVKSHGHGMHQRVLIKVFHFPLKSYFI